MRGLPKVLVIYTGGTIGMEPGRNVRGKGRLELPKFPQEILSNLMRERMLKWVPELEMLAHCDFEVLMNRDSAHIGPAEWILMAKRIRELWLKYDGVVLLHGTDTMAYTASALSFLLGECKRPVVITGAQKPLSAIRTDARRNLISAVEIAGTAPKKLVSAVSIFFDDRLFRGTRARKRSASEFAAFESPKAEPLAWVGTDIRYARIENHKTKKAAFRPKHVFSEKVAMLNITPGFPAASCEKTWLNELDALVLVTFSSGTAPTNRPDFISLIKQACQRMPVILVTENAQTGGEFMKGDPELYAAGRELIRQGCIWAGEMTPECAFVRTALLVGQKRANFRKLWDKNISDERSL